MKTLILISVCLISVVLTIWIAALNRDVKQQSWKALAPIKIKELAASVEIYKLETGSYPVALEDLATNKEFSNQIRIKSILTNTNSFQFNFKFVSNGFIVSVLKPSMKNKGDYQMYKRFNYGEALK